MSRRLRWGTLLAATLLTGALAPAGPAVAAAPRSGPSRDCAGATRPFTPRTLAIPGVVGPRPVLALGRDRNGVPKTPPLTDKGKWEFGWDRQSHIRPGTAHGVVRLNAHTYPRFAGLALGNRLLTRLHVGATLVVTGHGAARQCYRVVKRLSVPAEKSVPSYYASSGPPRLAILVCSGKRLGPGHWTHRTIWFARPV